MADYQNKQYIGSKHDKSKSQEDQERIGLTSCDKIWKEVVWPGKKHNSCLSAGQTGIEVWPDVFSVQEELSSSWRKDWTVGNFEWTIEVAFDVRISRFGQRFKKVRCLSKIKRFWLEQLYFCKLLFETNEKKFSFFRVERHPLFLMVYQPKLKGLRCTGNH